MRMLFTHALIIFFISTGFSFSQEPRYQIIGGEDQSFSWQEANAKAKTLSGHLATITSDEEMGIIARLLRDFERTTGVRPTPWVGGFEAGNPLEWRWVTGEPFTYTNWYIGLTTINPPGDDEIYLTTGSNGWQFYPQNRGVGRKRYFILEKPQNPRPDKILWSLGADDDAQDGDGNATLNDPATLNGVEFNVSGVQESGENSLPGNPANTGGSGVARDIDDDYYFAGIYTSTAGDYTPVGNVPTNELFYDRAVTSSDPNMRWHFNLEETATLYDKFQFTIDFYNLNEANDGDISGYDLTFWVDGKQIGEMQPHMDTNLSAGQSWDFDLDDLGGIEEVGPGFDHYIEVRTTPTGSARWASLDYVKLEGFKSTIIEPLAPVLDLQALYESDENETILIDATPSEGLPTTFDYQWCFNGFKIPVNLGGNASSFEISSLPNNEGTWSVTVTNSEGSIEQSFEYRLYVDSDSDGLSDGYEEVISQTDINNPDTDNDGLGDADEVNTYSTNPNSPDSDSDGFTDLYELETAYDPNSAESVPDALVEIMTAIEVKFNAALGATYAIEFSTDNQAWDVIEDDIVGEGGAIERLYSKQEYPTGFFRVERKDQ